MLLRAAIAAVLLKDSMDDASIVVSQMMRDRRCAGETQGIKPLP